MVAGSSLWLRRDIFRRVNRVGQRASKKSAVSTLLYGCAYLESMSHTITHKINTATLQQLQWESIIEDTVKEDTGWRQSMYKSHIYIFKRIEE